MAITARKRKSLPKSQFAMPGSRKYPIDTLDRARSALRLSGKANTAGSYASVSKKVFAKYPQLAKNKRKRSS